MQLSNSYRSYYYSTYSTVSAILTVKISDHFPVVYFLSSNKMPSSKPQCIETRDFSTRNTEAFQTNFNNVNWNPVTTDLNAQLAFPVGRDNVSYLMLGETPRRNQLTSREGGGGQVTYVWMDGQGERNILATSRWRSAGQCASFISGHSCTM
jgi:hypothetical protein